MEKIFVNHYLKEVEIGAFQSERGCTQRVEFNVTLEISPTGEELNDDVDRVLSYEIIVNAIDDELQSQRFNLLETLAERIVNRCLREPRVIKADVRIEKLDRIAGSLGVSISKFKSTDRPLKGTDDLVQKVDTYSLINFSSLNNDSDLMRNWISALMVSNRPFLITIEPPFLSSSDLENPLVRNSVNLLAMDQNAWLFSRFDNKLCVVSTRAELSSALQLKNLIVVCPSQFVKESNLEVPLLKNSSDEFGRWLGKEIGVQKILFVGARNTNNKIMEDGLEVVSVNKNDWKFLNEC